MKKSTVGIILLIIAIAVIITLRFRNIQNWVERLNESNLFLPNPNPVAPAFDTPGNVSIRVDRVWFENVADGDGEGELSFHVLAIRKLSPSTRLQHPSEAIPLRISPNSEIILDQVSLTLNDVRASETIYIHMLALDEDAQTFNDETMTDVAIDGALTILTELFEKSPFFPITNGVGIASFFAGILTGQIADWWREADVIGYYPIRLAPDNSWLVGRTYEELSDDGNMRVRFSVIDGGTPILPDDTVQLCKDLNLDNVVDTESDVNSNSCKNFIDEAVNLAIESIEPTIITVPITTTVTETVVEYITVTPTPPVAHSNSVICNIGVHPELSLSWLYGGGGNTGCPISGAEYTTGTYQVFENGLMIYSSVPDNAGNQLYLIKNNGNWKPVSPSQSEILDYSVQAPEGYVSTGEIFQDAWLYARNGEFDLGWAIGNPVSGDMLVQIFENRGGIFAMDGTAYFLAHSRRWVKAGCVLTCAKK